jgi:hypothetical protein
MLEIAKDKSINPLSSRAMLHPNNKLSGFTK